MCDASKETAVSEVRDSTQPHAPRVQVTCSHETVGKALKSNTPLSILLITKTAMRGAGPRQYCMAQAYEGQALHWFINCGTSTPGTCSCNMSVFLGYYVITAVTMK